MPIIGLDIYNERSILVALQMHRSFINIFLVIICPYYNEKWNKRFKIMKVPDTMYEYLQVYPHG